MEVGEKFFRYFHTLFFPPLQHADNQVVTKANFWGRGSSSYGGGPEEDEALLFLAIVINVIL